MKPLASTVLALLIASSVVADEKKPEPSGDPYKELFSFPSSITLDEEQKEKLAELRRANESLLTAYDSALKGAGRNSIQIRITRDKLGRLLIRKKNAILTEEQRKTLGIKMVIPLCAQEKSLADPKVWDIGQLEKTYTIESRNYDPVEQVISFMVVTNRKWTDNERQNDDFQWSGALQYTSLIQVIFYDKNEEKLFALTGPFVLRVRGSVGMDGGVTRVPIKRTDKQAEEGIMRYRIKIDLDRTEVRAADVASVKFVCPPLKERN